MAGTEVMPILVIVCGVFLLWFSGIKKGWLEILMIINAFQKNTLFIVLFIN
jgi:hypothetical protein